MSKVIMEYLWAPYVCMFYGMELAECGEAIYALTYIYVYIYTIL